MECRLRKGNERACTTAAASAGSVSVTAIATVTASVADAAVPAASVTTAAAANGAGVAAVSRSPEAAGVFLAPHDSA